jgi:hypothetical protein
MRFEVSKLVNFLREEVSLTDKEEIFENKIEGYTDKEIRAMSTIHSGHYSNVKFDDGKTRISVSRMTKADGAKKDHAIEVEKMVGGKWKTIREGKEGFKKISKEEALQKIKGHKAVPGNHPGMGKYGAGWKKHVHPTAAQWEENGKITSIVFSLPNGGTVEVDMLDKKNEGKVPKDTATDEEKIKELMETSTSLDFSEGDRVKIGYGYYKGKTGVVVEPSPSGKFYIVKVVGKNITLDASDISLVGASRKKNEGKVPKDDSTDDEKIKDLMEDEAEVGKKRQKRWVCPKCEYVVSTSSVYDEKICPKCQTQMKGKIVESKKNESSDLMETLFKEGQKVTIKEEGLVGADDYAGQAGVIEDVPSNESFIGVRLANGPLRYFPPADLVTSEAVAEPEKEEEVVEEEDIDNKEKKSVEEAKEGDIKVGDLVRAKDATDKWMDVTGKVVHIIPNMSKAGETGVEASYPGGHSYSLLSRTKKVAEAKEEIPSKAAQSTGKDDKSKKENEKNLKKVDQDGKSLDTKAKAIKTTKDADKNKGELGRAKEISLKKKLNDEKKNEAVEEIDEEEKKADGESDVDFTNWLRTFSADIKRTLSRWKSSGAVPEGTHPVILMKLATKEAGENIAMKGEMNKIYSNLRKI